MPDAHTPSHRFAVLLHTGSPDGTHYDLLIEPRPGEGDLLTWRLPAWPVSEPVEARQLRDHRRIYLTYQGTITGDRGHVTRIDEGTAQLEQSPRTTRILLPANYALRFDLIADDRWQCTPET